MITSRGLCRLVIGILMVVAGLSGVGRETPVAQAANAKPQTIPALREWTGGTGSYAFSATTRIVRNTANAAALATTGQTFVDDLRALTGLTIAQATGIAADARAGDIFLALGSTDTALGAEGYALAVTDRVMITARTDAGAFNGTRTILQLLRQSRSIPQGTSRDWPRAKSCSL